MKAKVTWIRDLQFLAQSEEGQTVLLDQSPLKGGSGKGVEPMRLLLLALAGCTGMDVMSILKKKRVKPESFEILVEGQRAPSHPKKYTRITLNYRVRGRDIPQEVVERAVELSLGKYCPVTAMLKGSTEIEREIQVEESD